MLQTFTDPLTGDTYTWQRRHENEDAAGKSRNISGTANTGHTGRVRQQGDDGPYILPLHGKIQHRDQLRQFWRWYRLCETQTIYFTDFDGQQYEVQIASFTPQRVRTLSNAAADAGMPHHYVQYDMTLEVYGFRAGDMHDMGVTP